MAKKLIGNEITLDLMQRIARLEELIICQHCDGKGTRNHPGLGLVQCNYCNGHGNRLDALEDRING